MKESQGSFLIASSSQRGTQKIKVKQAQHSRNAKLAYHLCAAVYRPCGNLLIDDPGLFSNWCLSWYQRHFYEFNCNRALWQRGIAATQVKYAGDFPIRHMNWFLKCQQWLFREMKLSITSEVFHILYPKLLSMTGGGFIQVHSRDGPACAELMPATRSVTTNGQQPPRHTKEIKLLKEFLSSVWHTEPHSEYQVICSKKWLTSQSINPHSTSTVNKVKCGQAEWFIWFLKKHTHKHPLLLQIPGWDGVVQLEMSQNNHRLLI